MRKLTRIFDRFRKPQIQALMRDKKFAEVSFINIVPQEAILVIFAIIKETAKSMGIEHRHLLNKLIEIDKQVVRTNKKQQN